MKLALEIKKQIEKLKSRNLIFEGKVNAEQFLLKNNYYRLSGYWRKYTKFDWFENNTTFEKIIDMYKLDASLANILLEGIRIFEICLRARFAYHTAHSDTKEGPILYLGEGKENNFYDEDSKGLIEKIKKEIDKSSELFIEHYKSKGEKIPIWAAIEVLSFGTVSKMYTNWKDKK